MKRCGVYVRSATGDRKAMATQEAEGIALCRKKGWQFRVFREVGKPAAEMRKLIQWVKAKKLNYVFVSTWDRFGRDLREAMVLLDEIRRNGVGIVTAAGCGQSIPAFNTLVFDLLSTFRRYELSCMAERRRASARWRNRR